MNNIGKKIKDFYCNGFAGRRYDLTEKEWEWRSGLYSVLYRTYEQAESELIDSLIQFVKFEKGLL